ncbi:uncharacterized protein At1g28695-like isoform X1 [Malania oleifera]|uniref:uncharacterized protein At1g28695-like isoform X1 n=1 Tax=Malania oleifera TaxID=397392 RepID=UPI0025AE37A0|nr:uncharacterized protein At1g28695-like isoform X1 [Malania oleifera]
MDFPKSSSGSPAILSLFVAAVLLSICICLSLVSKPFFLSFQDPKCSLPNPSSVAAEIYPRDELEEALRSAATADKTVIIAVVNRAYAEGDDGRAAMLDLFLESFWVGEGTQELVEHLLVVAMDQTAYGRCKFRRLHCYRLETEGVDFGGEKLYMSEDFIKMMWQRTLFLSDVLRRGYNFVFTDTDIMWLRNPFLRLSNNESEDLQISTDEFIGDPWSETNLINTGFYCVRSNNRTISLFDRWYAAKDNSTAAGKKEQDVLLDLMSGGALRELRLRVRFLDTLYFSGFCEDSRDMAAVTTVHANCCQSIIAKVADLGVVLRQWKQMKKYLRSMTAAAARNGTAVAVPWGGRERHPACLNSWIKKAN